MMDYCKWPPAVIKAKYEGLLKKFKPIEGDARRATSFPFYLDKKSRTKMLETIEKIIVDDIDEPKKYFWKVFRKDIPFIMEEAQEAENSTERQFFDIEGQRACIAVGYLNTNLSKVDRKKLQKRYSMCLENLTAREKQYGLIKQGIVALKQLQKHGTSQSEVSDKKEVK